jgi:sugar phosphate isomerase/epimerase
MRPVTLRLGATSYVVEAGLVENAAHLATRVQDMQLVLFDLPDGPSNLPDAATVAELARIAAHTGLTYTVHLTMDVTSLEAGEVSNPSLDKAQDVMGRCAILQPHAYVLHLDGRDLRAAGYPAADAAAWHVGMARSLVRLATWAGGATRLAVENLEGYPPALVTPSARAAAAARCVDVGHLWLDGHDPLPSMAQAGDQLRVVHLHGVDQAAAAARDHRGLDRAEPEALDAVVAWLCDHRYDGVVTLEVFGPADFTTSLVAFEESVKRYAQR